jgi:hypothetical protein
VSALLLLVGSVWLDGNAASGETLTLEVAPKKSTAQLKQFDAEATEVDCHTKGRGKPAGTLEVEFDVATRTASYTVALTGGQPNTHYLLDVTECERKGTHLARGDGGHFKTNARGEGGVQGTWTVHSNAQWVKVAVLSYCGAPDSLESSPSIPCGPVAFATDSLILPES